METDTDDEAIFQNLISEYFLFFFLYVQFASVCGKTEGWFYH